MTTYIIRRLLQGIIVLLIVSLFIFLVMRLLPGDPLTLFMAQAELEKASPEDLLALKQLYGLDKSLPMQYFNWLGGVLHGDLGTSIFMNENITSLIAKRMPVTLHLGILSMIISAFFGIFFGVLCGIKRGKWVDTFLTVMANIGITAPSFWVGILLIYFLALKLHWLPVWGYTSPFDDFWLSTRQLIMPVFCLCLFSVASLTRQARSSTLEVVRQDYIRTAWAKGLTERIIIFRHILKNALVPVITMLGMQVGLIFGGSVLIETVFNISGIGRLMRDAVFSQDYQIVQSGVLIISTVVVLSNLLVDISYGWFDPRIRYS
jgi:peptide/nickel transport system permease protein